MTPNKDMEQTNGALAATEPPFAGHLRVLRLLASRGRSISARDSANQPGHPSGQVKRCGGESMMLAYVEPKQVHSPFVRDQFSLAMFRSLGLVEVVSEFVVQGGSEDCFPDRLELKCPGRGVGGGHVDEDFNPGWLSVPFLVVETCGVDMPYLLPPRPTPLAPSASLQCAGIRQDHTPEVSEKLGG